MTSSEDSAGPALNDIQEFLGYGGSLAYLNGLDSGDAKKRMAKVLGIEE